MRTFLIVLTLISLSFMTPSRSFSFMPPDPAPFKSCWCSADDGSCSVTGYCPQGCLAYRPSGNCRFTCVGGAYEEFLDMSAPITLNLKRANSQKVAAELGRLTGTQVTF